MKIVYFIVLSFLISLNVFSYNDDNEMAKAIADDITKIPQPELAKISCTTRCGQTSGGASSSVIRCGYALKVEKKSSCGASVGRCEMGCFGGNYVELAPLISVDVTYLTGDALIQQVVELRKEDFLKDPQAQAAFKQYYENGLNNIKTALKNGNSTEPPTFRDKYYPRDYLTNPRKYIDEYISKNKGKTSDVGFANWLRTTYGVKVN